MHYAAAAPERMAYRDDVVQLAGDRALCYTGGRSSETGMVCGVCSVDTPIRVELARSGMTIDVPADTTILDAMLEAGVWTSYECRRGECGSCTATVLEGEPGHRDTRLTAADRAQFMCPCVSRAKGERLVLDL